MVRSPSCFYDQCIRVTTEMRTGMPIDNWNRNVCMVAYCRHWSILTSISTRRQHKTANEERLHSNEF